MSMLEYFGPDRPTRKSLIHTLWRLFCNLIVFIILLIVVIARAAILLAGYICVFVGTILLTLGGRRSAAEKVAQWRSRARALIRLWIDDIRRPLRRQQAPLRVLPA